MISDKFSKLFWLESELAVSSSSYLNPSNYIFIDLICEDCPGPTKWAACASGQFWCLSMRVCSSWLCCADQWGSVSVNQWDIVSVRTVQAQTSDVLFPSGSSCPNQWDPSLSELFWCHEQCDYLSVRTVLVPTKEIIFPLGLFWCQPKK